MKHLAPHWDQRCPPVLVKGSMPQDLFNKEDNLERKIKAYRGGGGKG